MDGTDAISLSGSASYNWQRGITSPLSIAQTTLHTSTGFRSLPTPNFPSQSNVPSTSFTSTFPSESSLISNAIIQSPLEQIKKKRGRPRKYGPGGTVSLGLIPMMTPSAETSLVSKRGRGRPPGTGRKQQLAALGQWMTESAGQAFAPHIITVAEGEDVAAKILSISQQRPRVVCVLSGNGTISSVTLHQPSSSDGSITFEGRFEILCLSGSYLVDQSGGPRSRIGGINVSLSSSDGRVIGGVAGVLVAASPVQVVMCSFLYGGSKRKHKKMAEVKSGEEGDGGLVRALLPPSELTGVWADGQLDSQGEIDLTKG